MIFGLGTGRCGTKSLALVLGRPHEQSPMPWIYHEPSYQAAREKAIRSDGDVGCYWLSYVERAMEDFPHAKFVCLKREKEPTVASWIHRTQGMETFALEANSLGMPSGQGSMFPAYPLHTREEAIAEYWEEYYGRAHHLEAHHPDRFRVFDMHEALNTHSGQIEMFEFCESPLSIKLDVHLNAQKLSGDCIVHLNGMIESMGQQAIRHGSQALEKLKGT